MMLPTPLALAVAMLLAQYNVDGYTWQSAHLRNPRRGRVSLVTVPGPMGGIPDGFAAPTKSSVAKMLLSSDISPRRKRTSISATVGESSDDSSSSSNGTSKNSASKDKATNKDEYNWTKQNLQIAIPALIGMLADPVLSLIDTGYVGHLGTRELAALGTCTSIFHLAFNAFRATTQATTSLVATSLQQDPKQAQQVTSISIKLGIFMGLCVMVFLQLGGTWCLGTMGVPVNSALYEPAKAYLTTRAWAAPIVLGIVVSEGAFRGYGDTKIPLLASLAASVINLVLDPILMFPLGLGVMGAAAATALAQVGAGAVYAFFLKKRNMLGGKLYSAGASSEVSTDVMNAATPGTSSDESIQASDFEDPPVNTAAPQSEGGGVRQGRVIRAILSANLAMMTKQGSLLLAWAYATSRATRIGANHVAAHQVALSCWLVLALMLDGAAVSAQVLMSRAFSQKNAKKRKSQVNSLIRYYTRFATIQGATACAAWLGFLGRYIVPHVFTSDAAIRGHLISLMPTLAWQQILVSLTLVIESLAVGGNQFQIMAFGTTISTILAMLQLQHATDIVSIWAKGINTLFIGRLITAIIATFRVSQLASKARKNDEAS